MFSADTMGRERALKFAGMIFLGSFLLSFLPSFWTPLYSRGEARESVVAFDMVNQQNFILPLRNGTSIPSKPPLFHWMAVGASHIIGELGAPAVRFPSCLSAALLLAVFFLLLAETCELRLAALSTLILASSVLWVSYSTSARVDMVFTLCLNLSLFCGWEIIRRAANGLAISNRLFLSLTLALTASVLSKGPAGLVLPVAACGLWMLLNALFENRRIVSVFPWLRVFNFVLLGVLLGSVWYYLAYLQGGKHFLDVHLMRENIARLTGNQKYLTGHRHGSLYVFSQMLAGFSPWGLFLPLVLWGLWKERRSLFSNAQMFVGLNVCWAALLFLAVCVSSSKRGVYLLPLYPSLSFLVARMLLKGELEIDRLARLFKRLIGLEFLLLKLFYPLLLIGLVLVLKMIPVLQVSILLSAPARLVFESLYLALQRVLPIMLITGLAAFFLQLKASAQWLKKQTAQAVIYLACAGLVLSAGGAFGVHTVIAQNLSPQGFIQALRTLGCNEFYLYKIEHYPSIFYAGESIPVVQKAADFPSKAGTCLLAQRTDIASLKVEDPQLITVAQSQLPVVYGKNFLTALIKHEN